MHVHVRVLQSLISHQVPPAVRVLALALTPCKDEAVRLRCVAIHRTPVGRVRKAKAGNQCGRRFLKRKNISNIHVSTMKELKGTRAVCLFPNMSRNRVQQVGFLFLRHLIVFVLRLQSHDKRAVEQLRSARLARASLQHCRCVDGGCAHAQTLVAHRSHVSDLLLLLARVFIAAVCKTVEIATECHCTVCRPRTVRLE